MKALLKDEEPAAQISFLLLLWGIFPDCCSRIGDLNIIFDYQNLGVRVRVRVSNQLCTVAGLQPHLRKDLYNYFIFYLIAN